MPTFTAVALDSLLEPGTRKTSGKIQIKGPKVDNKNEREIRHRPVSPTLYATPKTTPLPDSPSSFAPSPYIINHKRRGPRLLKNAPEKDVPQDPQVREVELPESVVKEEVASKLSDNAVAPVLIPNCFEDFCAKDSSNGEYHNHNLHSAEDTKNSVKLLCEDFHRDYEGADFFEPQESMRGLSNGEANDNGEEEQLTKSDAQLVMYFDACEELSSEGASSSVQCDIDDELHELKSSLVMEIEKRKQAEEALQNMQMKWERICQQLSGAGLIVPPSSFLFKAEGGLTEEQGRSCLAEDLYQQVTVARLVANSIGRGTARAEIELEMDSKIQAKNFEITRLCDRVHYFEAVNHEMSQRNQEAVERGRRHRRSRKRRQKWIWRSIGLAIALGSATLLWSYLSPSSTKMCSHDSVSKDATSSV